VKILIADDDASSVRILEYLLVQIGHEPVTAKNGTEAWDILSGPEPPRIVILDWLMPGLDGAEICRRVRASSLSGSTYILMLTIKGSKADIVSGLNAGANDYLSKPYDPAELQARVSEGCRVIALETALSKRILDLELNEKKIQTLLAEKNLLLYEVHHRIKNNMNMVINMLTLQADTVRSRDCAEDLHSAIGRLKAMGILYDKLYRSDDVSSISIDRYLPALIEEIASVYPERSKVRIDVDVGDFRLDVTKMACLGMIVNELICNTMKYAFVGREAGSINVIAVASSQKAKLIFEDDGIGIPPTVNLVDPQSFGLKLVYGLSAQIGGELKAFSGPGTRFILEFPIA
jgi:two-component sensor histidine kinase